MRNMDRAKTASAIHTAAAEFVNRESNRRSLITVTKVELDERGLKARVYVTVYPDTQAVAALDFLSRAKDDLKDFLQKRIRMQALPHCTFVQDPNIAGIVVGEVPPVA